MASIISLFLFFGFSAIASAGEVVDVLDFTGQPDGNALPWLQQHGYEFKLQFTALKPRFKSGALWLSTTRPEAGVCGLTFPQEKPRSGVKTLRITWGVTKSPGGADWEHGINRTPLAVMVSFGYERLSSGLPFGILAAPPFICPFLTEKEEPGKTFVGKFWKLGGRYVSVRSGKPGEDLVTELNMDQLFQTLFQKDRIPPVSAIGIQMNTKDTDGPAESYIKKIELLRGS